MAKFEQIQITFADNLYEIKQFWGTNDVLRFKHVLKIPPGMC